MIALKIKCASFYWTNFLTHVKNCVSCTGIFQMALFVVLSHDIPDSYGPKILESVLEQNLDPVANNVCSISCLNLHAIGLCKSNLSCKLETVCNKALLMLVFVELCIRSTGWVLYFLALMGMKHWMKIFLWRGKGRSKLGVLEKGRMREFTK